MCSVVHFFINLPVIKYFTATQTWLLSEYFACTLPNPRGNHTIAKMYDKNLRNPMCCVKEEKETDFFKMRISGLFSYVP